MLTITEKSGRWFKIKDLYHDGAIKIHGNVGWIHGSLIQFDSRNYAQQEITFYSEASAESKRLVVLKQELTIKLFDIKGDWVQVSCKDNKGTTYKGWVQRKWLCGNPLTNCC